MVAFSIAERASLSNGQWNQLCIKQRLVDAIVNFHKLRNLFLQGCPESVFNLPNGFINESISAFN